MNPNNRLIRSLKNAVSFFSNGRKFERENWVASTFLTRIGVDFKTAELRPADEPVDVAFREARFQIKEKIQKGRKRHFEYQRRLAEAAKTHSDLVSVYNPVNLTGDEIFQLCASCATELAEGRGYGHLEIASIDLLVYINYTGHYELHARSASLDTSSFRSVSYLSHRYASVIYSNHSAPSWLRAISGVIYETRDS